VYLEHADAVAAILKRLLERNDGLEARETRPT